MNDLNEVLALYAAAREFMKSNGNPTQWGDSYPPRERVINDIGQGKSYVCVENCERGGETRGEGVGRTRGSDASGGDAADNGRILAVFYFAREAEPTYAKIYDGAWLNDREYGVMHRVASLAGRRGAASFCLNWCYEMSGHNLRIDTHRENIPMQRLLNKNGFTRCGIIHIESGAERIAFQKE